jgi:hypothetical protein
VLDQELESAKI